MESQMEQVLRSSIQEAVEGALDKLNGGSEDSEPHGSLLSSAA